MFSINRFPPASRFTIAIILLGALFKIMHWPMASVLLIIGYFSTICILGYTFIKNPKESVFLSIIIALLIISLLRLINII